MNVLPMSKRIAAIAALTEGCSVRATQRLTEIDRGTLLKLGVDVGTGCTRLHDAMMRNLQVGIIEVDEQWNFIFKKQRRVRPDDPREMGDCYLWLAIDATSKAVLSYVVGK